MRAEAGWEQGGKEAPFCGPGAGRRRPTLWPPGPLFSCKAALCGGCGPLAPSARCRGGSRWGPRRNGSPSASPHSEGNPCGDACPTGTCGSWGTNLPHSVPRYPIAWRGWVWGQLCPHWAQGQLTVPTGQSSVLPWEIKTAQCPFWAQIHATVAQGDSSVPPLGTGISPCLCWSWGQLDVPVGHSSVPPLGTGMAQCHTGTAQGPQWAGDSWSGRETPWGQERASWPLCSLPPPPPAPRGDLGGAGGQVGTQGTLRATPGPWHELACVPTPSPDKDRV